MQPAINARAGVNSGLTMAYEDRVATCQLDESLESLRRLDLLLIQIRHELISEGISEGQFLSQQPNRKFMLYLGQYCGQVLAKQSGQPLKWLTHQELIALKQQASSNLISEQSVPSPSNVDPNDFYERLACLHGPQNNNQVNLAGSQDYNHLATDFERLFLVMLPIGMRLFGSMTRQFYTLQGALAEDGLFQAVSQRLASSLVTSSSTNPLTIPSSVITEPSISTLSHALDNHQRSSDATVNKTVVDIAPSTNTSSSQVSTVSDTLVDHAVANKASSSVDTTSIIRIAKKPAVAAFKESDPLAILNGELIKELKTTDYPQSAGEELYLKASKVLDIFEGYISAKNQPRSEVQLSAKHDNMRQEAVTWLRQSAEVGNTAAMMRLAIYSMLGEGTSQDMESGVNLIQKAANMGDPSAQRLLSKLYYQGLGLAQDMKQGRYWLEEAAKNGHIESMKLLTEWQQAEALAMVQQEDQKSDKRYLILIAIVIVLALLLIIFL
ncbi:MAG: tetratricopeptide repeat protein [Psychrobacter sp.]|nr:tetratricopeptide repeat protein [Psychrobacter sp.]